MKKMIFTIDLEEWFQSLHFDHSHMKINDWYKYETRIDRPVQQLLDLLDRHDTKCTFFVLGWVAETHKYLIREIHSRGHEIASHGHYHQLVYRQSIQQFEADVVKSKHVIEDVIGEQVFGYRAPCFSITSEALDVLYRVGFSYDSSIIPKALHDRYSKTKIQFNGVKELALNFWEIPLPYLKLYRNLCLPWGGGGHFRIYPYSIFKKGIDRILQKNDIFVFYMHPWEIDNKQPVIRNTKLTYKFRHHYGLRQNLFKIEQLLIDYRWCSIRDSFSYVQLKHGH